MKHLIFCTIALIMASAIYAQKKSFNEVAKFNSETIDLGKIIQGNPTTANFIIVNIGTEPLIIESVQAGCGCTVPGYTKEPIMPGKTGVISATYNAAAVNPFQKTVTIKLKDIDEQRTIFIKGEVVAAGGNNQSAQNNSIQTVQNNTYDAPPPVVNTAQQTSIKSEKKVAADSAAKSTKKYPVKKVVKQSTKKSGS